VKTNKLITWCRQELGQNRLISTLTASLVTGAVGLSISISFAALIFSGELENYVGTGVGIGRCISVG